VDEKRLKTSYFWTERKNIHS